MLLYIMVTMVYYNIIIAYVYILCFMFLDWDSTKKKYTSHLITVFFILSINYTKNQNIIMYRSSHFFLMFWNYVLCGNGGKWAIQSRMTCVVRFGSHILHKTEIALATHTIFCHTSAFIDHGNGDTPATTKQFCEKNISERNFGFIYFKRHACYNINIRCNQTFKFLKDHGIDFIIKKNKIKK